MIRVLVAGASGFLGRNILIRKPTQVHITALYHRQKDFPEFVRNHSLHEVETVCVDLQDRVATASILAPRGPWEGILQLAANGDPTFSVDSPAEDSVMTTLTTINLLNSSRGRRVVYVSSGAVYDGLEGSVSPEVAVFPRLPYAISHLAAEHYVSYFTHKKKNFESAVILRFFGAYGPFEPPRKIYTRLVRAFALEGRKSFTIRGDGSNLIDAMYVDDAANAIWKVLQRNDEGGVFDLPTGNPVTIENLVQRAASIFGCPLPVIVRQGESAEPIRFVASASAFSRTYGPMDNTPLEVGLTHLLNYLKSPSTPIP